MHRELEEVGHNFFWGANAVQCKCNYWSTGGPRLSGWLGPKKVPQYFWYHYPQNRNSKNRGIATIDWIFYWSQYCKIKVIEVTLMEDPLYLQINICFLGLDITKIYPISTQFMSTEESIDYYSTDIFTWKVV